MLYIQESEDENRPFGPDTYALVDENLGGIVAYISPDYLERMKEYIDTQNAPREFLVRRDAMDNVTLYSFTETALVTYKGRRAFEAAQEQANALNAAENLPDWV